MEMYTEIDNCNLFNVFIMDIVDITTQKNCQRSSSLYFGSFRYKINEVFKFHKIYFQNFCFANIETFKVNTIRLFPRLITV